MKRRLSYLFMIGGFFIHSGYASTLTLQQFQAQMNAQLGQLAKQTTAGVHIEVLGSSEDIFSANAETPLMPASSSKLMTTSAALEHLGPHYTYETRVSLDGKDLVMAGNGDPYLVSERMWTLARAIAQTGLRHVHSIRIDNSAYLEDYTGLAQFAGFDGEDDASIVSATSVNYNVIQVFVTPNAKGIHPTFTIAPSHNAYGIITNNATQVSGKTNALVLTPTGLKGNQETFALSGTIGQSSATVQIWSAVRLPESHFAYALAGLLRDFGVSVDQDYGGMSFDPINPKARVIASQTSLTLTELADLYMPASNNFMAEEIFQAFGMAVLGGRASIHQSQTAMAAFLKQRPSCQSAHMVNGSGLTWSNFVSPHCFIETIQELSQSPPLYNDLIGSLPVGGKSGTLAGRFQNPPPGFDPTKVHAKTGTLWSKEAVSSLIGQTQIASGQTVLFAFIENDSRNEESLLNGLKNWEDACVELLQELHL